MAETKHWHTGTICCHIALKRFQHLVPHCTHNCHDTWYNPCVLAFLKGSIFILLSYSQMGQTFVTSLLDINHGLIILQTWSKMAHGVITWFCMRLQTAIKHTFTWLAVSQITVTLLSGLMATWSAPTHLCWAMFMKSTMSACNLNKVRLHATHCRKTVCW